MNLGELIENVCTGLYDRFQKVEEECRSSLSKKSDEEIKKCIAIDQIWQINQGS